MTKPQRQPQQQLNNLLMPRFVSICEIGSDERTAFTTCRGADIYIHVPLTSKAKRPMISKTAARKESTVSTDDREAYGGGYGQRWRLRRQGKLTAAAVTTGRSTGKLW